MQDDIFKEVIKKLEAYMPYSDSAYKALDKAMQVYGYPKRVFTYGTTPFSTFSQVMPEGLDKEKIFYCIGCSIGWMCFYANYLFGVKSIGIDLHSDRLQYGQKIKDMFGLNDISFVNADALKYDFNNAGCVWMSNLCFPDKVSLDLFKMIIPKTDCCISYKMFTDPCVTNLLESNEMIKTPISAPTSWDKNSSFYSYQRKSMKRTAVRKAKTSSNHSLYQENYFDKKISLPDNILKNLYKDRQVSKTTNIKENMTANAEKYLIGGKKELYFHTEAFNFRQMIIANYLQNSQFVLEIGGYPKSVGDYLYHDNYLSIDPLYEKTTNNKISSTYQEAKFSIPDKYDLVLLGFSLDVNNKLLEYAKNAGRIILEYAEHYTPSKIRAYNFLLNLPHKILYNFLLNLDQMEIKVNNEHSWTPMYERRFIFLVNDSDIN